MRSRASTPAWSRIVLAAVAVWLVGVAPAAGQEVGLITAEEPVLLAGADLAEGNSFSYPGLPAFTCPESHYRAGAAGITPISPGRSQVAMEPAYTNCKMGIFPVTVDMNDCVYLLSIEETTAAEDTYGVLWQLTCPESKMEIKTYGDGGHSSLICTWTLGEQLPSSSLHFTDTTNGLLQLHGSVSGVHISKTGGGCGGEGTTAEAAINMNVVFFGINESEEAKQLVLSEGEENVGSYEEELIAHSETTHVAETEKIEHEEETTEHQHETEKEGKLTADGSFYLAGTDEATGNGISYPGLPEIKCAESHYLGSAAGEIGAISSGAGSATVFGTFTGCKAGIFPATIATNACDYLISLGKWVGGDSYGATTTIACPEESAIHVTVYGDEEHKTPICTVVLGAQGPLSGFQVTDTTNGKLRIAGTGGGVKASKSGGACGGAGETEAAVLKANFELSGKNEEGEATTVAITR